MKMWGGRFGEETAKEAQDFTASVGFDQRLAPFDVLGSLAHVRMLERQGLLAAEESKQIIRALEEIKGEIERGEFPLRADLEDIHLNIEARLTEKIGEVAGKLHTGRSRNDQVALDMRLYIRDAIVKTGRALTRLQETLLKLASAHQETLMPGYTHLQRAQPIVLAHHLLAYFEMFQRDLGRFQDAYTRADVMPLGSGALAGSPYPFDREFVAKELGFSSVSANSLDAVSDRDFVIEYLAAAALTQMHLSRLAEELILWSSAEFGFVEMADAYSTGSSLMPQKKNPDVAELIRAKSGRVFGHLVGLLAVMKALPLAYNRDLQEDKEGFFDTVDTLLACLGILPEMLESLKFKPEAMRQAASSDFSTATDLADYLVAKGLPFRQAHQVAGQIVKYCEDAGKGLAELDLADYKRFSELFDEGVFRAITPQASVKSRALLGGTAPDQVARALDRDEKILKETKEWLKSKSFAKQE